MKYPIFSRLVNGLIEEPRVAVGGAEPYARNLRSHFARANDLGKFGRIQWTTL